MKKIMSLKQIEANRRNAQKATGPTTPELTDAALQEAHLGGKPNSLTRELEELRAAAGANTDNLDAAAAQAMLREVLLDGITRILVRYKWKLDECTEREDAEENAHQAATHLPAASTLDKILRYETTLERQLYRAMNQLERLQRMRQGELVPAPLTMEVNTNGESGEK
jgi:hypothetical protein